MPCPTAVEYCIFAVVLLCYPAAVRLDPSALLGMMGVFVMPLHSAAVRLDPSALLGMMGIGLYTPII